MIILFKLSLAKNELKSTQASPCYGAVGTTTPTSSAIAWLLLWNALDQILITQKRPSWRRCTMVLLFLRVAASQGCIAGSSKKKKFRKCNTHSYFVSKSKITLKCFPEPSFLFSLTETARASMVKLKYYSLHYWQALFEMWGLISFILIRRKRYTFKTPSGHLRIKPTWRPGVKLVDQLNFNVYANLLALAAVRRQYASYNLRMSTHLCAAHVYVSWKYQKVLFSVDFSCNRMQHSLPEEACPASPWTPPSSSGLLLNAPVTSQHQLPSSCVKTQLRSTVATTCILRPSLYKLKLLVTETPLYPTSCFLFQ